MLASQVLLLKFSGGNSVYEHRKRGLDSPLPLLQNAKARLKVQESELKSLRWEHEVLEQRFAQVQSVREINASSSYIYTGCSTDTIYIQPNMECVSGLGPEGAGWPVQQVCEGHSWGAAEERLQEPPAGEEAHCSCRYPWKEGVSWATMQYLCTHDIVIARQ